MLPTSLCSKTFLLISLRRGRVQSIWPYSFRTGCTDTGKSIDTSRNRKSSHTTLLQRPPPSPSLLFPPYLLHNVLLVTKSCQDFVCVYLFIACHKPTKICAQRENIVAHAGHWFVCFGVCIKKRGIDEVEFLMLNNKGLKVYKQMHSKNVHPKSFLKRYVPSLFSPSPPSFEEWYPG